MIVGPIELLIIQATPFCNLDCNYCYLPNRLDNQKITIETIEKILDRIFESGLIQKNFSILWHAGEPMIMPLSFYKEVLEIVQKKNKTSFKIKQNFQTNATLINEQWCLFLLQNKDLLNISISIDGPKFIHDNQRLNRKKRGTFNTVISGIDLLTRYKISFGIISVITDFTLDYPDEYYNFFKKLNPKILGLNVEEVEGTNNASTLYLKNINPDRYVKFMVRLYDLYVKDNRQLNIREFKQIERFILGSNKFKNNLGQQTTPFRIITIDVNGHFSTFSPELLSVKHQEFGDFIIGNIFEHSFESSLSSEKFKSLYTEIIEGILMCRSECEYYNVCGGGIPSNKYSEHKTFKTTETNHCKFKFQWLFDTILSKLESTTSQYLSTSLPLDF